AERLFLADRDEVDHRADRLHLGEELSLPALQQRTFELRRTVEVVENRVLPLGIDDDQLLEARVERFLDPILQNRLIDQRQHLLGDDLRRRKEARAEARARKHTRAELVDLAAAR